MLAQFAHGQAGRVLLNNLARSLSTSSLPTRVTLYEVGPRDGLQTEQQTSTDTKVHLINMLVEAGLRKIEATSFVSPKWVPQFSDARDVMARIQRSPGVSYPVLTPNLKGFQNAIEAGASEVAVFAAASETFSQKNTNCSIAQSLERLREVALAAQDAKVPVRGYVSCVVGCPYEGPVDATAAADIGAELLSMGCYEVAMSDTTGVGTPASIEAMFLATLRKAPADKLAAHLHDTYGQALANILTALRLGIGTFDTAVAGLGGCPYAPGASGNVATEDVVYLLNGYGIDHGVDLERLLDVSAYICAALGRPNSSRVARAVLAERARQVSAGK